MTGPDPQREPESETEEKPEIHKTHEEYIDDGPHSIDRHEYEKKKKLEREKAFAKSDLKFPQQGKARPQSG